MTRIESWFHQASIAVCNSVSLMARSPTFSVENGSCPIRQQHSHAGNYLFAKFVFHQVLQQPIKYKNKSASLTVLMTEYPLMGNGLEIN